MASLLDATPRDKWSELYKSIGFWFKDRKEAEDTTKILSFSYYDLPLHLRTCLLYLSAFPEDSEISKHSLVWKWVAEGFVPKKEGMGLFEIGEGYFNELVNRSMIQAVESRYGDTNIVGCRVHDIVLDFICPMSNELNFFSILDDNDRGTQSEGNVHRLALHNRTLGHTNQLNHVADMGKVRSFSAQGCAIERCVSLSNFRLLRVLAIENCNTSTYGRNIRIEHLGHLLHLRYLSLRETSIDSIPKEMGGLKLLQTLDLLRSLIVETSWSSSLPTQLVCLRITLADALANDVVASMDRLTSLEELSIDVLRNCETRRWILKELGSLRELRVLNATIFCHDDESERDFVESLGHLHKLQHLAIDGYPLGRPFWEAEGLVLSCHLRHLAVHHMLFRKLPPCINHSCLPVLSHLDLSLLNMDEKALKILGGLQELHFLELELSGCSPTISNVSDSDGVYFPELRCCIMRQSMFLLVANKEDKRFSFHLWSGEHDIAIPSDSHDDEMQRSMASVSGDELQTTLSSVSNEEHQGPVIQPSWKLQHGLQAIAYYLLAFFQPALAFVKKWLSHIKQVGEQPPVISNSGSAPGNGEDATTAMHSAFSDDENKKGSICSNGLAAPRFMPRLEVLQFKVPMRGMEDPRYCDNLGLEYLPSLRKVGLVDLSGTWDGMKRVEAALMRASHKHPNRLAWGFLP